MYLNDTSHYIALFKDVPGFTDSVKYLSLNSYGTVAFGTGPIRDWACRQADHQSTDCR